MMLFRQLQDPVSSTFTYLLADEESREAIIIDTVFEQHTRDVALIRELGLHLKVVLDTHCHADHVTGAWRMKMATGGQIAISGRYDVQNVDLLLQDGDVVRFGARSVEVRETPGHTEGCLTYVTGDHKMAFTGDALMIRGTGRTDFQKGSPEALYRSITQKIFTLPDETSIYPCHDYLGRTVSTVAEEKAFNPRVGGNANEQDFVGFLRNVRMPHPKKIDIALPANLRSGRPEKEEAQEGASWGPVQTSYAGLPEIDPQWVVENQSRLSIIDVRSKEEFEGEMGYIEGAKRIELDELRDRLGEISKERPVVLVCRSGRRSALATIILREAGWKDVANLAGGMWAWNNLSLPVG